VSRGVLGCWMEASFSRLFPLAPSIVAFETECRLAPLR
jgi:hypothetical protein